jgi:hypothetical protein
MARFKNLGRRPFSASCRMLDYNLSLAQCTITQNLISTYRPFL